MSETVTSAITKRDSGPAALIKQYSADFTTVLPGHINGNTWVRLAVGVLRRDKQLAQLAQRNPGSLLQALLECARLGHEPGGNCFYLVPIGGEIEGWESYRGVIERMFRAGAVTSVKAEIVKDNDHFHYQPHMDRPEHEVTDWFGDRGEIRGAYAYAELRDGGTSKVVVIGKEYIAKVKAMSKGSDKLSSPWVKWPDAMVLKTVIHRLEPFVPTSASYMREQLRAMHEDATSKISAQSQTSRQPVADLTNSPELPDPAVTIDAEIVDEETQWARDVQQGEQ
jgi:recombination protein RecT